MRKKHLTLWSIIMSIIFIASYTGMAYGEENPEGMMKKMMEAGKKNFLSSLERGEELYSDSSLGTNGLSCNSCHPRGGTAGGSVEMKHKGMIMKPKIPSLKGAAANFPAPRGPEQKVVTLKGMNNLCIKAFLIGEPLDENSQKASDLANHVSSFSIKAPLTPNGMMKYE